MADRIYRYVLVHAGWFKWLLLATWLLLFLAASTFNWSRKGFLFDLAFVFLPAIFFFELWARWQRERVIREWPLPQYLKRKLRQAYPGMAQKDADLVERGLRQFFLACSRSRGKFVAMPSRAVDTMWHDFILHTAAYKDWCTLALGRFLHHTPAEALGGHAMHNDGLRRAWYFSCRDEAINPRQPTRLPLLFALDGKLAIPNGFHYVPDCGDIARKSAAGGDASGTYCATSFSDGSASGDADGFGGVEASGGAGDGGADGSGCGGGGCGGGGD